MDKSLEKFAKSMISEQSLEATQRFREYFKNKVVSMVEALNAGPIKIDMDDVFVNDKLVGHIHNDLDNLEQGIVFIPLGTAPKQEFVNIKGLYQFLLNHYTHVKEV